MPQHATLEEITQHLDSRDPAVRIAALQHASAHGHAGKPLATRVALALEDPDPAVQYTAMGAFRAVGRGADAAVPELLRMLRSPDADGMLRTRALFLLGVVGPAAVTALPVLLELAPGNGDAVEALLRIAGEPDERVADVVRAALLDDDLIVWTGVARALEDAPDWLAERMMSFAEEAARTAEHADRAHGVARELRARFPVRVRALSHRALAEGWPHAAHATRSLEQDDAPVPLDVARGLLVLGREGDAPYDCLASSAERLPIDRIAEEARAELVPQILEDGELRRLASVAQALGAIAPGEASVVPSLIERTRRELGAKAPKWYPIGGLAVALAQLADVATVEAVTALLHHADRRAKAFARRDRSAVLDLQRRLKRAFTILKQRYEESGRSVAYRSEADLVDAAHHERDEERARRARELPPIPEEREAARVAVRRPRAAELAELARARDAGLERLRAEGLDRPADPDAIAQFVEAEIHAMQQQDDHPPAEVAALAALYGDALVDALGWSWKLYTVGALVALAVVSEHDEHVILPGKMVTEKLRPGEDLTFALTLNMLRAGTFAPASPGALCRLG